MKTKSRTIIIIGALILSVIAFGCVGVILYNMLFGTEQDSYSTTDIREYKKFDHGIDTEEMDLLKDCGMYVFPDKLPANDLEQQYYYYCENGWENEYQIFLKVQYSEEDFKQEIERLSKIHCTINTSYQSVVKDVMYSEELFDYPAYVSVYDSNSSFENVSYGRFYSG